MIEQRGIFNKFYESLITPVLKKDTGVDAEYLTNLSLNLLTHISSRRNWPLISAIIDNLSSL